MSLQPSSLAPLAALLLLASPALASELGADRRIHFAADALSTYGFESTADLGTAKASWLSWTAKGALTAAPWTIGDNVALVAPADPLEGGHALRVGGAQSSALALLDPGLAANAKRRVSISFWGLAQGAEPVLEVIYGSAKAGPGPYNLARVVAVRTGRETSDGWAEYSTGPIDGAVWGFPIRGLYLTVRRATDTNAGASAAIAPEMSPTSGPPTVLDPSASALFDAVEVRPEPGTPMPAASCTAADVAATCGPAGECMFGHCYDATFAWGPVPLSAQHRSDLIARMVLFYAHQMGDRQAGASAATTFAPAAQALAAATTAGELWGPLNRLVVGLRDSHTALGAPPTGSTLFYPYASHSSSALDACFGVAVNDVAGSADPSLAVYTVDTASPLSSSLKVGDVVTKVDGVSPWEWIANVEPTWISNLPNDPAADPTASAYTFSSLVSHHASTLVVARCKLGVSCAEQPPLALADTFYQEVNSTGGWTGSTRQCSQRFHPSVSNPPPDDGSEQVVVETGADGITALQFDGYEPANLSGFKATFASAFASPGKVLIDARVGHGGWYSLGRYVVGLMRGTSEPFGEYVMPRSAYDAADDPWLFTSAWDPCADPTTGSSLALCQWSALLDMFADQASPPGAASKIAWMNAYDVSMNDITPHLLKGRSAFRIFSPHPTKGAYGEITYLQPVVGTWYAGTLQITDTRFGPSLAEAKAARWESGFGVAPDQVVAQKVSDILQGHDTLIDTAKAWLEAQ
jgi:hypothetical protein